jgi:signal transduction histidine kinase
MTLRPIQETNRRLKEYNHHVAHELKTPLSVLKSNLELTQLSRNICDLDSSKEEIESLEQIINGLLFLSENTLIQSKQKIDIIPLFENVIDSFLTEKEIKLQTSKPHIFVYTEKILFERLLKNLVENALKYTADNIVYIDVKKASFEIRNAIDFDIEKRKLESIFDPFYKLDNSRSST